MDNNLNFDKIDRLISYLKNLLVSMDLTYQQEGGKTNNKRDNDKYYKKYKNLVKTSEYSIKYYKKFKKNKY